MCRTMQKMLINNLLKKKINKISKNMLKLIRLSNQILKKISWHMKNIKILLKKTVKLSKTTEILLKKSVKLIKTTKIKKINLLISKKMNIQNKWILITFKKNIIFNKTKKIFNFLLEKYNIMILTLLYNII